MMTAILITFIIGYTLIAFEHNAMVSKSATALVTGVLCWTLYSLGSSDASQIHHQLETHIGDISGILFFLLGAMVVVELIDAHNGFDIITRQIQITRKVPLLWCLATITFFLSAVLDNLTTTIVMISLQRKLIDSREDRLTFAGMTVIAANAGGAWSPIGDVTTTMLWIGGQISALNIMASLLIPSLVCLISPLIAISFSMRGDVVRPTESQPRDNSSSQTEQLLVFSSGVIVLTMVPVFKTVTGLPPFMGMLLGLGLIWALTELIHSGKTDEERSSLSVGHIIRKVDTPSILFFLGILLAVSALQSTGQLASLAGWLDRVVHDITATGLLIGLLSAVVDNVPLVAAVQAMYPLDRYPADDFIWELMAYCTGTGGSALIIGSAAGVAAMGLEKIDFFWYLKKISLYAVIGYLAGAAAYVAQYNLTH